MENFNIKNLIDLINEAGEQDASADTAISMDNLDATFDDLGVDSLTFLSVVAQLEARYGIRVRFEEAAAATTPAELFEIVNSRLEMA
jgi:acyl carrier protein